ncbi:hypothetical protein BDW71DRAFT_35421 [Aspergillus fruticulosus]
MDGYICQFQDCSEQPRYHDTVSEAAKYVRGVLKGGDRSMSCYLYRLPFDVRFRIYEELFKHDGSALEIGRLKRIGVGYLAILRVSHIIYHEASIALYHSLSYRKLFIRTFGVFSADLLTSFPTPLPSCGDREHNLIEHPCRSQMVGWHRAFGSILMLLGSTDLKAAMQRRWSFMTFLAALKTKGPVHVYNLTVVVNNNWKVAGFDENLLIKALFGGDSYSSVG